MLQKGWFVQLTFPRAGAAVDGHRQMNFLLSKGGCAHEGGWGEAAEWSRDELGLQKLVKCLITDTHFVAVYLLHFTNAPVGF